MIWKDVKGYEGLYKVSDTGLIKSLIQYKGMGPHVLSCCTGSNGYQIVVLCDGNTKKSKTVHRIVATAFSPNPNGHPCINHKDEDKTNNAASNLEWCSYSYNGMYGVRGKILEEKRKAVAMYSTDGCLLKVFKSRCDAAKEFNGQPGCITRAINGGRKTYKGYVWKEYEYDAS